MLINQFQVLYEELKLDQKLKGKAKIGKTSVCQAKSTGESSLRVLADVHSLPSLVLEYRQVECVLLLNHSLIIG